MESKTHEAEKKINTERQGRMKAAAVNDKLQAEKAEMEENLSKGHGLIKEMESKVKRLEAEKKEVDRQVIFQMFKNLKISRFFFCFNYGT